MTIIYMKRKWTKDSWRTFNASQQPEWPDTNKFEKVIDELSQLPSLVFSGETRKLIQELAVVNKEEKFILQAGNCAESFSDCNGPKIHNFLRILLQMSKVLEFKTDKKVIRLHLNTLDQTKICGMNTRNWFGQIIHLIRGRKIII